jgi:colanic acid/amylovoran biosynthesis glycosyltransferase
LIVAPRIANETHEMKIAFVVGTFPALSETFILNQITGLLDRGHDVEIYATGPRDDDPKVHPDVDRYGLLGRTTYVKAATSERVHSLIQRSLVEPGQIWQAVRRRMVPGRGSAVKNVALSSVPPGHYDIVHCHFGESGLAALRHRAAGRLTGKLVTTFYGADLTQYLVKCGNAAYTELFKRGDQFLAICDYFHSRLVNIGCPADRIQMHPLGINPSTFAFIPRRLVGGEAVRLVTIARFVEKKGLEYALRALGRIGGDVRIDYTIIGDGPLRPTLEALAGEVSSNVSVRFAGWLQQDDVARTLGQAHILLAPSVTASNGDQEGTPVAILEALASGLPVISTWHSGVPETVQDGKSGRLVPERDVAALAGAIDEMANAPEKWIAFGQAGRAYVAERHDIDTLNDNLVKLYEQLLARG